MTRENLQSYDMAILNLMIKHPECRTYESILARAREDKYLETIVHNALNHLCDEYEIVSSSADRNDITKSKLMTIEEYNNYCDSHLYVG